MQTLLDYKPNGGGDGEDGTFWMQFSDFSVHFEDIYVCRLFRSVDDGGPWYKYTVDGSWKGRTAGGCTNTPESAQWNPQYFLQPTKPCTIVVQLSQKEVAGESRDADSIGIKVVKKEGKRVKAVYAGQTLLSASYTSMSQVVAEGSLSPASTPFTLFVSTFDPGVERDFLITVYCDAPLASTDGSSLRLIPTTVPAV